eukprot:12781943-Prorocentrum_lima.AAC.1
MPPLTASVFGTNLPYYLASVDAAGATEDGEEVGISSGKLHVSSERDRTDHVREVLNVSLGRASGQSRLPATPDDARLLSRNELLIRDIDYPPSIPLANP